MFYSGNNSPTGSSFTALKHCPLQLHLISLETLICVSLSWQGKRRIMEMRVTATGPSVRWDRFASWPLRRTCTINSRVPQSSSDENGSRYQRSCRLVTRYGSLICIPSPLCGSALRRSIIILNLPSSVKLIKFQIVSNGCH